MPAKLHTPGTDVQPHLACAPEALPLRLKAATQTLHRRAERSALMAALLARRLPRADYLRLLHNLHALYAALESLLDAWPASPFVSLQRRQALERDLAALGSAPDAAAVVPAMHDIVARLGQAARQAPHRLVAHAYVRYLGDLHGGQLLRERVCTMLGLQGPDGSRFYDFGDVAAVQGLRDDFRRRLTALRLAPEQADEVVDEAVWAFEAHCHLFEQLSPS